MRKLRKWLAAGLSMTMALALVACGSGAKNDTKSNADGSAVKQASTQSKSSSAGTESKVSTLEPVTLKMYFLGEPQSDNDMVFEEINKKLTEKINAKIEPHYLSWGDYQQRYPLLFSSGEDFDMIYTAAWAFYAETASKGGFYEITPEMVDKYCPLAKAALPEAAWTNTQVAGKNYMIPQNNYWANHYGAFVRGDLRKKYGMEPLKTVEDIEKFMAKVKENESGMIPLDVSSNNSEIIMRALVMYPQGRYYLSHTLTYDYTNSEKLDLVPFYDLPGFEEHIKRMKDWNQKGYISKSDLTSSNTNRFDAGKSAVKFGNIGDANTAWQNAKQNHPDWEVEYINLLENKPLGSAGFTGNGVGFNARSKNIERALMATDLLNYDKDLNFLINNGIPGVHSKLLGTVQIDGHDFQQIEVIKPDAYGGISTWCFANTPSLPIDSFPKYGEIQASYYFKQLVFNPVDGMSFVLDSVNTEQANVYNVRTEYTPILYLGFAEDPMATLAEFKEKLKAAGEEKFNQEITKQAQVVFDAAKK